MNILFLGDIVGKGGCRAIEKIAQDNKGKNIDFVIANGENAADDGNGITEKLPKNF